MEKMFETFFKRARYQIVPRSRGALIQILPAAKHKILLSSGTKIDDLIFSPEDFTVITNAVFDEFRRDFSDLGFDFFFVSAKTVYEGSLVAVECEIIPNSSATFNLSRFDITRKINSNLQEKFPDKWRPDFFSILNDGYESN